MKTKILEFLSENHKFITGFVYGLAFASMLNFLVSFYEFKESIRKLESAINKTESLVNSQK